GEWWRHGSCAPGLSAWGFESPRAQQPRRPERRESARDEGGDQREQRPARSGVGNAPERFLQPGGFRRIDARAGLGRRHLPGLVEALEEILDRHIEQDRERVEAAGPYPVHSLLVFLHLAEGQSEVTAQPALTDPERLAPFADPPADIGVDLRELHPERLPAVLVP